MLADALPVTLKYVGHFRSIGCLCVKPTKFLALQGDVAGPERVAWQTTAINLIVTDARATRDGNYNHKKHEISNHVRLLPKRPFFLSALYQRRHRDARNM